MMLLQGIRLTGRGFESWLGTIV